MAHVWTDGQNNEIALQTLQRALEDVDQEMERIAERRRSLEIAIDIIKYKAKHPEVTPKEVLRANKTAQLAPLPPRLSPGNTLSDVSERIIGEMGPLHVDELIKRLKTHGINTTRKNFRKDLLKSLNRWVQKGSRFERPAPLTYAIAGRREHTA